MAVPIYYHVYIRPTYISGNIYLGGERIIKNKSIQNSSIVVLACGATEGARNIVLSSWVYIVGKRERETEK